MIPQTVLEQQIRRMGGLDDFPRFWPEAESELVLTAARVARSEAHLRGIIDEIMAAWTKCPKPSELRALLDRDREEKVNLKCLFCHGSGWRFVEKDGATGAARCKCGSVPRAAGDSVRHEKRKPRNHSSDLEPVTEEDLIN